jgi:transcriptional regulator with XRE-family HTH domain
LTPFLVGPIYDSRRDGRMGGLVETSNGRPSRMDAASRSFTVMNTSSEIREFLASRRARLNPEQAGLPAYGGNRRVKGLRREEVALLAGVSVDYYTRLERGNLAGASESVLEALARALQLDEAERIHLFDLARTAATTAGAKRRPPAANRVRPSVQRVLDAMTGAPAWLRNGRADVLATNRLGHALYAPIFDDPTRPANTARFAFLDPRARDFYPNWERVATEMVAVLRAAAGRDPYNKALSDLIGELSTRSEAFRVRWAAHNVQFHRTGRKTLHHPVVGDLDLTYEAFELPSDPGLTLLVYTAEPNSPTAEALSFLASWAATQESDEAGPVRSNATTRRE